MNGWEFTISYVIVGFCCAVATAIIADENEEVGKPPWLFAIACAWPIFALLLVVLIVMCSLYYFCDGFCAVVRATAEWLRGTVE